MKADGAPRCSAEVVVGNRSFLLATLSRIVPDANFRNKGRFRMARKAKKGAKKTAAKRRKKKSPGMLASAMKTVRKGTRKIGL